MAKIIDLDSEINTRQQMWNTVHSRKHKHQETWTTRKRKHKLVHISEQ